MILVIGGLASGKREYVKNEYGYHDSDMADGVINDKPVLYNLQNLVAKAPEDAQVLVPALLQKEAVICNEVGCGIVPILQNERLAREATGRLCIELAKYAHRVIRLQCGIPSVIKAQGDGSRTSKI